MKLLLVAGHGGNDPGAVGSGYKEANLTRELLSLLVSCITPSPIQFDVYPTSHNLYKDVRDGKAPKWTDYDFVLELHFNAFNGVAGGTEVLVHTGLHDHTIANSIQQAVCKFGFTNRGVKERSDLLNMNQCYKRGVPYALLETCFIDNVSDMKRYQSCKKALASELANCFYVKPEEDDAVYRVQVGAYTEYKNALTVAEELQKLGYSTYIRRDV